MKKYYFITYEAMCNTKLARRSYGIKTKFNDVIDISPMKFLQDAKALEDYNSSFTDHVITNTLEITKEEFEEFELEF